ncbi:ORF23 [Alphabaculovirus altermyunipunctae]|jgi:hypothetical protein|uniref:ORF23 n=1 Tax=Mythimna unipuncta nucleopolyhedrovirus TaxID=447897 RepID=A0A346TPG0_9ABAC|nr:ORF23 [Mythimna unipuncta nucleopolyhedrovirus]AXU41470.1 ORF23 [Mythimna unipuncta nucleopolyhedrovirus]
MDASTNTPASAAVEIETAPLNENTQPIENDVAVTKKKFKPRRLVFQDEAGNTIERDAIESGSDKVDSISLVSHEGDVWRFKRHSDQTTDKHKLYQQIIEAIDDEENYKMYYYSVMSDLEPNEPVAGCKRVRLADSDSVSSPASPC